MHNHKGNKNPNYRDGRSLKTNNCIECNRIISWNAQRCSVCANKGKNNPAYKNGKPTCVTCGKTINYHYTKCQSCGSKEKIAEKNPNWKGGIGRFPYAYDFYLIRKIILQRDKYKCQLCQKEGICVHHINYNKQTSNHSNLITLCSKCHSTTNGNRDYWFAYFAYIMKNSKGE